jgi:hypothetical protein
MLTALRIINVAVWSVLLGKDVRRGDPMRLGVAGVCLVIILGNLRWLLAPDNDGLFIAIYLLSALVGTYIIRLGMAYGRGPRL